MDTNEGVKLLQKLKLWQIVMVLGIAAPFASHYGWEIPPGQAILIFLGMVGVGIIIRYFPPPDGERRGGARIAISAHQSAFCAQFSEWTEFEEAYKHGRGPEDEADIEASHEKLRQLRLELGTVQRILMRKVENGKHYVRYFRGSDETTFVPPED
jgi:hypothetical protein